MLKFFSPAEIPANVNAVAYWEDENGGMKIRMVKSIHAAKITIAKNTKNSTWWGWHAIQDHERKHGIMVGP